MLRKWGLITAATFVACASLNAADPQDTPIVRAGSMQVGPWDTDVIEAVFVRADTTVSQQLRWRFEAQTYFGDVTSSFDLLHNAQVTRNGQPARLFDLRNGDRLVIHLTAPRSTEVTKLVASSR